MKILLDEKLNKYKANLHCHSTVSDGCLTPEELKKVYTEHGYSIIAYTDHDVMIAHDELNDESFLALHGYEMQVRESLTVPGSDRTTHMCFIQRDPDNMNQVCWNKDRFTNGNCHKYKDMVRFDKIYPHVEFEYTAERVNDLIKHGTENGFFVTYNHPAWSGEDATVFLNYFGMNAMEICNFGAFRAGYDDYSPQVYDSLLRNGRKLYCIAADDNHNPHAIDSPRWDSFGGFTVIFADKLDYKTVTDAMFDGKFYASQGPEISSLVYEDNKMKIKCSAADRIIMSTMHRRLECAYAENEAGITEAEFEVMPTDEYVRITVTDRFGKHANTNAYFVEDLIK